LRQLSELFYTLRSTVVAVRRNGILFVPNSQEQLSVGDQVYLCTNSEDKERCLEIFGKTNKKQDRVIIIGGGNVGLMVAKGLENNSVKIHTKVIEANRDCAERIADQLERTIVLHGDGLDMDILEEANISKADAVLAVTDDDKTNLLACARAKALGCPMVVALINDPTLTTLLKPLNIDASVNPRATTVSSILRHVRHGRVKAVYSIGDAEAEVIEAQVMSTSPIVGLKIREVEWPNGSIIGAIQKSGKVLKPEGDTKIEEGDFVIIFTLSHDVSEVERLFQVNIDFS
ncbi:MAG: Trk system potassium transporter TrkA, partial [Rhodobacterales bacterium]